MKILQIRAVAPLLVVSILTTLGCDGGDSHTLLFNGGVGPSPVRSSLIVTRPDVSVPPPQAPFSGASIPSPLPPPPAPFFGTFIPSPLPPSPSGSFVSRGVMVQPASIQAVPVNPAFCPVQQPFVAPFNVVVTGDGRSDLFLSSVQMQFADLAEIRSGVSTLGRPELAVQFGSTAVPAVGTRAFPLSFPFGCNGLSTGTLTVVVIVGDSRGREATTVGQVAVR